MPVHKRLYEPLIKMHFDQHAQMLFLAGPRQVGKTTLAFIAEKFTKPFHYLNWDNDNDRDLILGGPRVLAAEFGFDQIKEQRPLVVFDEIHKYPDWKTFLKGVYDTYKDRIHILVTGSTRLDVYSRGGDSLMGRYFIYRIHPLSVGELANPAYHETLTKSPKQLSQTKYEALLKFGGFPDPYFKQNTRFSNRWRKLWEQQLFREDLRDLTRVHQLSRLELFARMLKEYAGQQLNHAKLATRLGVSGHTVSAWVDVLSAFYYCFTIQPYSKNINRALVKQPKVYLWDWSLVSDEGQRAENFIGSHLLKAVHFWNDDGAGDIELFYLRDRNQHEVDFLIVKDREPWMLVEVKLSEDREISPHLRYFYQQIKPKHAFQVVLNMPYINRDCFEYHRPVIVPALTFLSQLI